MQKFEFFELEIKNWALSHSRSKYINFNYEMDPDNKIAFVNLQFIYQSKIIQKELSIDNLNNISVGKLYFRLNKIRLNFNKLVKEFISENWYTKDSNEKSPADQRIDVCITNTLIGEDYETSDFSLWITESVFDSKVDDYILLSPIPGRLNKWDNIIAWNYLSD